MPVDGDTRYNSGRERWEQFHEPPGLWQDVEADFGELDRPVDVELQVDGDVFHIEGQPPDAEQ